MSPFEARRLGLFEPSSETTVDFADLFNALSVVTGRLRPLSTRDRVFLYNSELDVRARPALSDLGTLADSFDVL